MRHGLSLLGGLLLCASVARAQEPPELEPDGVETDCADAVAEALAIVGTLSVPAPPGDPEPVVEEPIADPLPPPRPAPPGVPSGRAVANLSAEACTAILEAHHIPFHPLDPSEAEGVDIPIRLDGPVAGVRVESRGHSELHEIVDCRLAVAVLAWSPSLREAGVEALLHYSTYRPGARVATTGRRSGHAGALAIDLAVVRMDDGTEHEILNAWEARERGAPPCEGGYDEGPDSARLRRLVCDVASTELFQVVLTPHFDAAHGNHVHLELRPGVAWQYLR
ncbi:MAG: extensin family protein [Myxococcales bacterium]|nr:extensin family protein [Myxococcales bacterium]